VPVRPPRALSRDRLAHVARTPPVTALVWLTGDLRVDDHPPLRAALDRAERVVPFFCLDDRLLSGRNASGPPRSSCPSTSGLLGSGSRPWVDLQPFFRRLYDPARRMERFDPRGDYVRRHVPELRGVPNEYLREPWAMPEEVQRERARVHSDAAPLKRGCGHVDSRHMSIEATNGLPEGLDQTVTLELSLAEAEAVKSWLLKPAADGSAAIDDENAKSVMVKLGAKLDFIEGVARVRDELEAAGFPTDTLTDEQVAELGRRIAESPIRRYAGSSAS
jgi:DNA photolyase-like FAD binding protein/DNA photolyase